jgi:hypothetical protein
LAWVSWISGRIYRFDVVVEREKDGVERVSLMVVERCDGIER